MKNISQSIKPFVISGVFFVGLYTLFAWTGPTQTAPNGNVSAPINIGASTQTKAGDLTLGRNLSFSNGFGLFAKNSTGTNEQWMWPRYSDDIMYTNFATNGWIIRDNSSNPVMTMLSNGNVGIGTTTPTAKMEVQGDVCGIVGGVRKCLTDIVSLPSCAALYCGSITTASGPTILPSGVNYVAFTARGANGGAGGSASGRVGGGASSVYLTPFGGAQKLLMVSGGGGGAGYSSGNGGGSMGGGTGGIDGQGGTAGWDGTSGVSYIGGGGNGGDPDNCTSATAMGGAAGLDGSSGHSPAPVAGGGKGNLAGLFVGGNYGWRGTGGGGGGWGGGAGGDADTGCNGGDDHDGGGGGGGGYRDASVSTIAVPGLSGVPGLLYPVIDNITANGGDTVSVTVGSGGTGGFSYAVYGHR